LVELLGPKETNLAASCSTERGVANSRSLFFEAVNFRFFTTGLKTQSKVGVTFSSAFTFAQGAAAEDGMDGVDGTGNSGFAT
jgi:hypothetical protein